jgi:hypothetical protein
MTMAGLDMVGWYGGGSAELWLDMLEVGGWGGISRSMACSDAFCLFWKPISCFRFIKMFFYIYSAGEPSSSLFTPSPFPVIPLLLSLSEYSPHTPWMPRRF